MAEVAKTPWKKVEHSWEQTSIYSEDGKFIATLTISDEVDEESQEEFEAVMDANAALIVRAVNAHDDLVDALQRCYEVFKMDEVDTAISLQVGMALAKAKGE